MEYKYFTCDINAQLWRWDDDSDLRPMMWFSTLLKKWTKTNREIDGTMGHLQVIKQAIEGWKEITLEEAKKIKPEAFTINP